MSSASHNNRLLGPDGKLTKSGQDHVILTVIETLAGLNTNSNDIYGDTISPTSADIQAALRLLDEKASPGARSEIFKTFEHALAPLNIDVKKPAIVDIAGPSFADPDFIIKLAEITRDNDITDEEILEEYQKQMKALEELVKNKAIPDKKANVVLNVFLPPMPFEQPPTDAPVPAIATAVQASRMNNFTKRLGLTESEVLGHVSKLVSAFTKMTQAKPVSVTPKKDEVTDQKSQPDLAQQRNSLSTGATLAGINATAQSTNPVTAAKYSADANANPKQKEKELVASSGIAKDNNPDKKSTPQKAAIVRAVATTSTAQAVATGQSAATGTGMQDYAIYYQLDPNIEKSRSERIDQLKFLLVATKAVELETKKQKQERRKRQNFKGGIRGKFQEMVSEFNGKVTTYKIGNARIKNFGISTVCDMLNLSRAKNGSVNVYGFDADEINLTHNVDNNSDLKDILIYSSFVAPYHVKDLKPEETVKIKQTALATIGTWSSCALTVRGTLIRLRDEFSEPNVALGSYYTTPYSPGGNTKNAVGAIINDGEKALFDGINTKSNKSFKDKETAKKILSKIKPGDFIIITARGMRKLSEAEQNLGPEHVAMFWGDEPPELGKSYTKIFEGGQFDVGSDTLRKNNLNDQTKSEVSKLKSKNSSRINTSADWTFKWGRIEDGYTLLCDFKVKNNNGQDITTTKRVMGIYDFEKYAKRPIDNDGNTPITPVD